MTPVGHSITGLTFGAFSLPKNTTHIYKIIYFLVCIFLANIPDIQVKGWGHYRYYFSHSLFVNLTLICFIIFAIKFVKIDKLKNIKTSILLCGAFAWLSHLLLDSFYNHGKGIAIFWPFGDGRLALPMPWFEMMGGSAFIFDKRTIKIYLIAFLFYTTFLVVSIWIRYNLIKNNTKELTNER